MKIKIALSALLLGSLLTVSAFAHKGAMGIVKVRMDAMSDIGKNMKAISGMLTGKTEFDIGEISKKAKEIAVHSRKFPDYFKKEIKDNITEASPAIGQQPEKFRAMSNELADLANAFAKKAKTAENAKILKADFKAISGTCRGCHEKFRIKK